MAAARGRGRGPGAGWESPRGADARCRRARSGGVSVHSTPGARHCHTLPSLVTRPRTSPPTGRNRLVRRVGRRLTRPWRIVLRHKSALGQHVDPLQLNVTQQLYLNEKNLRNILKGRRKYIKTLTVVNKVKLTFFCITIFIMVCIARKIPSILKLK